MPSRRFRRLCAAVTVGAALAAAPAAVADDSPVEYLLTIGADAPVQPANTYVQVSVPGGTPPGAPYSTLDEPARMRISRGGAVLDERTAEPQGGWVAQMHSDVVMAPGDRVEIFYPASAEQPARDFTWDGRPSLDSCAIGANTVGGTHVVNDLTVNGSDHPGTWIRGVLRNWPAERTDAAVTQVGETWTGAFDAPLMPGDFVTVFSHYKIDPKFGLTHNLRVAAGSCEGDLPVDPIYEIPTDGALDPLARNDIEQRRTTVRVRVGCKESSRIRCKGRAVLARAGKTVRARKLSVAPGKSSVVKLKLTRRVAKQLERRKRLKARVVATTSDAAGKRLTTSRRLTLKR